MRIILAVLLGWCGLVVEPAGGADWEVTRRSGVRFVPVDILIDSGRHPMAAYQCTFSVKKGDVRIVGIEGGEHAAFQDPPYYDPRAMQRNKVILAAFDTGKDLPRGRTRVATIHLEIRGKREPVFALQVEMVAGPEGELIKVETNVEQRILE